MNKNDFKKTGEEIWNTLKNSLEYLSWKIGQYFILVWVIYFIYFLYKFYPSLISFENATIIFLAYFFIFLFYKKDSLKSYLSSYMEGLNDVFEMINWILAFILFFWIFVLYMWWQGLDSLAWIIILFYISVFFWFLYDKNKKIDLLEKKDYKKDWFLLNFIINIFLFLYFKKWLLLNDVKDIYFFIFPILIIYNIFSYFLFNIYLQKSNTEIKTKKREKLSISKIFYKIVPFILLILIFFILDKYNNQIITNKKLEEENIRQQNEILQQKLEEERKIIKIATWSSFPWIPQKIDYSILYNSFKIWDYYNFERNIYLWDEWEDVEKVQEILKLEWFYTWSLDWIFDLKTSQSLQKFFNSKTKQDYDNLWIDWLTLWKLIEIKTRKNPIKTVEPTTNLD